MRKTNAELFAEKAQAAQTTSKQIFSGKLVNIHCETVTWSKNNQKTYEIIEHPGAVGMLPIDETGRLILIEQWRRAIKKTILEIPAGTIEANEDLKACAIRELQEETGYKSNKLTSLGSLYTTPGFCNEVIHIFLAEDLTYAPLTGEDTESIDTCHYSLSEIHRMIAEQQIHDSKTLAAISLLRAISCQIASKLNMVCKKESVVANAPSPKRSKLFWILISSAIFGTCVALFLAFLPMILSNGWGKAHLIAYVENKTEGKLTIEQLKLSWFQGQKIDKLAFKSKKSSLNFETFQTSSSLFTILLTKRAQDVLLMNPELSIFLGSKRKSTQTPSLKPSKEKTVTAFHLPFMGGVNIKNGLLIVQGGGFGTTQFKNLDIRIKVPNTALPITVNAHGQTSQNGSGGDFQIQGMIDRDDSPTALSALLTKSLGLPKNTYLSYSFKGSADHFPLTGFDGLLTLTHPNLYGLITQSIGNYLNLNFNALISSRETQMDLDIKAPYLKLSLNATEQNNALILRSDSKINGRITPEFASLFEILNFQLEQPGFL